jgi:hypothetical protein
MFETRHDKIGVLASFKPDGPSALVVQPHMLKWGGRNYKVDRFGMHHVAKRGEKRVHVFGFSAGANDFTVELDPESLEWTLVEVYYGH